MHKSIGAALAAAIGFQPEEFPYAPHITLARLNSPAPPDAVQRYLEDNKDLLIPPVLLKRFVLYSSVAVDGVPQYREEAVFSLTTPTAPDGQERDKDAEAECLMTVESSDDDGQLPEPAWRPQFSVRSILVLTFAVAVWLSICRMVPHVAVFLLGTILAAVTTYSLIRLKREVRGCRLRRLDRLAFAVLWTLTPLSWAFFYVVSIGPVVVIVQKVGMDGELLKLIYRPVIWLHESTPLAKPIEAYADAWGWH